MEKTSLTGIKPSGTPHLGNYLGAIRPALALAKQHRSVYFIADYHALTTVRDPRALSSYVHDVAATWLACGLDPNETVLFRQSDVPEVFELSWVLSCLLATGQLERGHAYKDALSRGEAPNAGLFNYPVLMAADILLYDTDLVPVGRDQQQHVELARDVAQRVNHLYGDGVLVVPEALITDAPLVPGLDGQKMGKSEGNAIPLFESAKALRKAVMKIETSSEGLDDPKLAEGPLFELYQLVATGAQVTEMRDKLAAGGYGWGHAKEALAQVLEAELGPMRDKYQTWRDNEHLLGSTLSQGASRARRIAHATMQRVRTAVGIQTELPRSEKATVEIKRR